MKSQAYRDKQIKIGIVPDDFWENIKQKSEDKCWPWVGASFDPDGYGQYRKRIKGTRRVHKIVYINAYGVVDGSMQVCHHCDNPPCCNPKHLFLSTFRGNMQDKLSKNRQSKYEQTNTNKLVHKQVEEIRELRIQHVSVAELSIMFGVSKTEIYRICNFTRWP